MAKLTQCGICNCLLPANNTSGVCNDCWEKDDAMFDKVRSVMKFGEKFLPEVLSEKTGVDMKHIQRWARQGRFG